MTHPRRRPPQSVDNISHLEPGQSGPAQMVLAQAWFTGPLPHPQILKEYEAAVPGSGDRIITQMEEQGRHRRSLETKVINSNIGNERLGQIFGFILGFMVIAFGFYLINNDKDVYGLIAILSPLTIFAGLFVYGKESGKQRLKQKREHVEDSEPPNG